MNWWSLSSGLLPSAVRRLGPAVIFAAFLSVLCGILPVQAQNYSNEQTFYFGDSPAKLRLSSQWTGVQVTAGTSLDTVSKSGGSGRIYKSQRVVLFPKGSGALQTEAELKAIKGVSRIIRVFDNGKLPPIVETNDILVRFKPGTTAQRAGQLALAAGASLGAPLGPQSPGAFHAYVNTNTTAIDASNALRLKSEVLWANPNFVWPLQSRFVPNDPLFPLQDHLRNTGQNGGTPGADIKAVPAWDITIGSPSITIAVMDSGIDIDHEDLSGRIVAPRDVLDDDNDPRPVSGEDHGTAVAGLALASARNAIGVSGVAPNCRLMPVRLVGFGMTIADQVEAFTWAATNGADVINNSWGPPDGVPPDDASQKLPPAVKDAIDFATGAGGRGGRGCVVLFASGNGDESVDSDGYASYSKVIAVGSSTNTDRRSGFSDFGTSLDLVAPGGDISASGFYGLTTTDRTGAVGYTGNNYALPDDLFAGTSAATPVAAGVAALVLSRDPGLTSREVQLRLESTADKIDPAGGNYDAVTGHSDQYGSGRVNALAALQATIPGQTFSISGTITLPSGAPAVGVTVVAVDYGAIATTGIDGTYTIDSLPAGSTLVVPSDPRYTFIPPSRDIVVNGDVTGVDFVAQPVAAVDLIDPPSSTVINTPIYTLRATTANDSIVQRVEFERTGDVVDFTRASLITIPDADQAGPSLVTDVLPVNLTGNVARLTATVRISHPRVQDLVITLIAPDGRRIGLYNQTSTGTSLNLVVNNVNIGGGSPAGLWMLEVSDVFDSAFDVVGSGTLVSWGLSFTPWINIGTALRPDANGEWTAQWIISQTPPGVYDVRAIAIAPGPLQQDIHNNIVIPEPTVTLVVPETDDVISTPIQMLANTTGTGTIQSVSFYRRNPSATFMKGSDTAPINLFIPDLATVTSELTIPGGGVSSDATLHLNLQHDYVGDLRISLVLPDGTTVVVFDDPSVNDPDFLLDLPLPDLIGKNVAGTYKLIIQDRSVPDTGTLLSWGITTQSPWVLIGTDPTPDANGAYTFPFSPSSIPGGIYEFKAVATTARGDIEDINTNITVISSTKPTFTISGIVTKNGTPLAGVRITRTGNGVAAATALTNALGEYTLPATLNGTYTLTPSLTGHSFTPLTRTVALNGGDLVNINFVASAGYSISGRVTTANGTGVANVVVKRSGSTAIATPSSTTTDSTGRYSFVGLPSTTYAITPSLTNALFTPTTRSVTLGTTNVENVNFSAIVGASISGRVTDSFGNPINNVRVTRGGSTNFAITNTNGEYSLPAVPNGTYFLVASRAGYTFTPISRSVTVRGTNLTDIDFAAAQGVRISGRVLGSNGKPLSGVRLERTGGGSTVTATTGADGNFFFDAVLPGTYSLRPIARGQAFTPAARAVTVSVTPLTTLNFQAVPDVQKPTVAVTQPVANQTYISLAAATGTAGDSGSRVARVTGRLFRAATATTAAGFWAGGTTWTTTYSASVNEILATGTTSWRLNLPTLESGSYSFRATATDNASNVAFSPEIGFKINNSGPTVTIRVPVAQTYAPVLKPRTATGTAVDPRSTVLGVTVRLFRAAKGSTPAGYWAGGNTWTPTYTAANEIRASGTTNWQIALPDLPANTYTLRARAVSKLLLFGTSAERTFTIGP